MVIAWRSGGRLRLFRSIALILLCFLAAAENSQAQQTVTVRAYLPNPADEDWSFLRDGSKKTDFWDALKYLPLGHQDRYLTLSGEIRFRPEGVRFHGPEGPSAVDSYLLQRYLVGADLHLSRRFRIFTELQSGIVSGKLRSPRPTDQNTADIHQAFLEWRPDVGDKRAFAMKVGRQEVVIGSSRLISASPGLNVKRSFDGVVLHYDVSSWRFSGVAAKLVSNVLGSFDDRPDHEQTFWGMSAARPGFVFKQAELAVYYLNVDRAQALYVQGLGRDQRHTAGVKWSGPGKRLDVNYDAILQWGVFNDAHVRAWAFSTETAYRFPNRRWKPRVSVRADFASGDKDSKDPRLQSFNPLFPGSSYAGIVGLFGPTNLTDFTPAVSLRVRPTLVLTVEVPSYWRTSSGDGIYGVDQRVLIPPTVGEGKYVGTNPGIVAVWQATSHLQFQGVMSRFLSGGFLENTFVANGFGFYSATARYRF